MEYSITACPSFHRLGLCNQLCLVLNAINNAFQVISNGVGVVIKPHIKSATYGGKKLEELPDAGYQRVSNDTLTNGNDPQPGVVKHLDIEWKSEYMKLSRYEEGELIHWLDYPPVSVCVYIDRFNTHYTSKNKNVPYTEILDIDKMNEDFLLKWGMHLECKESHLTPNSLFHMIGGMTPKNSLLFKKLISMLRFHPSFYEAVGEWLDGKEVCQVAHIRNEDDAIKNWSMRTGVERTIYESKLNETYMDHIRVHFSKDKLTIVLTSRKENNPIIDWMMSEGYNVGVFNKADAKNEREIAAIYDLIIATYCKDIFIGSCKMDDSVLLTGSSFSFFLWHLLPDGVRKIDIDIDGIR